MENKKDELEYETRITRVTILPKGEPIFCEEATHIEIDDECSGEFIKISQVGGHVDAEKFVLFNSGEWALVNKAALQLFAEIAARESESSSDLPNVQAQR
jgi:hypothetical protein